METSNICLRLQSWLITTNIDRSLKIWDRKKKQKSEVERAITLEQYARTKPQYEIFVAIRNVLVLRRPTQPWYCDLCRRRRSVHRPPSSLELKLL